MAAVAPTVVPAGPVRSHAGGRRLRPPAGKGGVVVAVLALALLAGGVALSWLRVSLPSDLTQVDPGTSRWTAAGVAVDPVGGTGPFRPGDMVVGVDGVPLYRRVVPPAEPGQHLTYLVRRQGRIVTVPVAVRPYPVADTVLSNWATLLTVAAMLAVGLYVFVRRPRLAGARVLLVVGALAAAGAPSWMFGVSVLDLGGGPGWWDYLAASLAYCAMWAAVVHFTLVFPDPVPLLRRRPWAVAGLYLVPVAIDAAYFAVSLPFATSPLARFGIVSSTSVWVESLLPLVALAVLGYTYRTRTDPGVRQRLRWLLASFGLATAAYLGLWEGPALLSGRPLVPWDLHPLAFLPCPLALAAAVLARRAFDIDVVVRRSLLYGGLTAAILCLYAAGVDLTNAVASPRNDWTAMFATGIVVVLVSPLWAVLQKRVTRLFYGRRDDPYAVISDVGQRLEASVAPEEVLGRAVEAVAKALRLPYVAIDLVGRAGLEPAARWGRPCGPCLSLPLAWQGADLGRLQVGERGPGEPFRADERRLFDDLAHQIGAAAHAARLTADVQESRARLVSAREEERRRIQRDLHDGLAPTLAASVLRLQVVRDLVDRDAEAAKALTSELAGEFQDAISDIRRLVHDLRPPALDQLGLVATLRQHALAFAAPQGTGMEVLVEVEGAIQGLPAAVEVAALRIVVEALNNAARHARARRCLVRLVPGQALEVEVVDDGVGLPAAYRSGLGLVSMEERAVELGGSFSVGPAPGSGTRIWARLPLRSA